MVSRSVRFAGILLLAALLPSTACSQPGRSGLPESTVSLDEKIGQMLMVGFQGSVVSDTSHVLRDITEYHVGGVLLFDVHVPDRTVNRNIIDPEQVQRLVADLQSYAQIPLFVAVDQEGGRVARLKTDRGFVEHRSAAWLGHIDEADSTRKYAGAMARSLRELGFNVNFAPVVDLNTNEQNPIIGMLERSFGADPDLVTRQAVLYLEAFDQEGVLGVLKHFPGHGSAWNDSHVGMADVTDTWQEIELEPYRQLAQGALPFAVMTAHVVNRHLDEQWPATLSERIQTGILRQALGFEGVLFSDDMQMEAIRAYYGFHTAIERALLAGVDVLVFANNSVYDREVVPAAVQIIRDLVDSGVVSEARIDESFERIMRAKEQMRGAHE